MRWPMGPQRFMSSREPTQVLQPERPSTRLNLRKRRIWGSVQIQSPRLKTGQLVAINRDELFLIGGQWFAMETLIEIAVQFDE
jgi:hypothetical protein